MMAVLIVFGVLLGLLALILWLTGDGGPADIMRFWDEDQGR
jgi:hypothetical protein